MKQCVKQEGHLSCLYQVDSEGTWKMWDWEHFLPLTWPPTAMASGQRATKSRSRWKIWFGTSHIFKSQTRRGKKCNPSPHGQIHSPAVCVTGSGGQLTKEEKESNPITFYKHSEKIPIKLIKMLHSKGYMRFLVWTWFPLSYYSINAISS
jgi:hypothetical protein